MLGLGCAFIHELKHSIGSALKPVMYPVKSSISIGLQFLYPAYPCGRPCSSIHGESHDGGKACLYFLKDLGDKPWPQDEGICITQKTGLPPCHAPG